MLLMRCDLGLAALKPFEEWGLSEWSLQYTFPRVTGTSVAGSAGFAVPGERGIVFFSKNAVHWQQVQTPASVDLNVIAVGADLFVAAGARGDGRVSVVRSADGINWTESIISAGTPERLSFSDGWFLLTTNEGELLTSTDASAWTLSRRFAGSVLAIYGDSQFVVVPRLSAEMYWGGGARDIQVSRDGIQWKEFRTFSPRIGVWQGIAHGNGRYIVVGDDGWVGVSMDGQNWEYHEAQQSFVDVTFGDGIFVAIREEGEGIRRHNSFWTSSDGIQWTVSERFALAGRIGFTGGTYYASYAEPNWGSWGVIWISDDAQKWERRRAVGPQTLRSVAKGPDGYVLVGTQDNTNERIAGAVDVFYHREPLMFWSADGLNWENITANIQSMKPFQEGSQLVDLTSVVYKDGLWVARGDTAILVSENGRDWADRSPAVGQLSSALFANGTMVAATWGGGLFASSDQGRTWKESNRPAGLEGNFIRDLAFGNGMFVAAGGSSDKIRNVILSSPDGYNWTQRDGGRGNALTGVAFGNGRFVAVRWFGSNLTSEDGIQWTEHKTVTLPALQDSHIHYAPLEQLSYGHGYFVSRRWASIDGKQWKRLTTFPDQIYDPTLGSLFRAYSSLVPIDDRFLGLTYNSILRSEPVPNLQTVSLHAGADGFRIERTATEFALRVPLTVEYRMSITNPDGSITEQTGQTTFPAGVRDTAVYPIPGRFQSATLSLKANQMHGFQGPSSATIKLPDGGVSPRFRLFSLRIDSEGRLVGIVDAAADAVLELQASTDLAGWTTLRSYTGHSGEIQILEPLASKVPRQFYRMRQVSQ